MDPTSAVARTEHLVLWSRLGTRFRVADLERMLWDEHSLFEYWAHIVPVDDYDIHRESMRRFRRQVPGEPGRRVYWREWMAANAAFRRYVLARAPAPRSAPHARPGGPCRRGVADRRVERSGQVDGDDARAPLGARRSHGRGQGRTAPALGPGRAEPADGRDRDRRRRRSRVASWKGSCVRGAWPRRDRSAGRSTGVLPGGTARSTGWSARASRSPPASATSKVPGTSTPMWPIVRSGRARRSCHRSMTWCPTATTPRPCSTSGSGSRSTCRRPSASSATSCCRSCTATG